MHHNMIKHAREEKPRLQNVGTCSRHIRLTFLVRRMLVEIKTLVNHHSQSKHARFFQHFIKCYKGCVLFFSSIMEARWGGKVEVTKKTNNADQVLTLVL